MLDITTGMSPSPKCAKVFNPLSANPKRAQSFLHEALALKPRQEETWKLRQGKQIKCKISLGSPCTVWIHKLAAVYESKTYPYESAPSRCSTICNYSTAGALSITAPYGQCHLSAFKVLPAFWSFKLWLSISLQKFFIPFKWLESKDHSLW